MDAVSNPREELTSHYTSFQLDWKKEDGVFPSNQELLAALSFLILRYTGEQNPSFPAVINGRPSFRSWKITGDSTLETLLADASVEQQPDDQNASAWKPIFISSELEAEAAVDASSNNSDSSQRPDICFVATTDTQQSLSILSYRSGHEPSFLEQMIKHWAHAIVLIKRKPEAVATTLPILTDSEFQTMTLEWNDTFVPSDDGKFDFEEFDQRAKQIPDKVAISTTDRKLTYKELHTFSNQMAHYLQSLGVEPEVIVGIYLPRSIEFVVSVIGLTKSGGAFLPLDPDQAADRKAYMIQDSEAPFIICSQENQDTLPEGNFKKLIIEEVWKEFDQFPSTTPYHKLVAGNMSYLFYTSGSTGEPKGVCMTHTYQDRRDEKTEAFPIRNDKVLLKSSTGFTVILLETYTPIKAGGEIVVVPRDLEKDASWMIEAIHREQVETLNLVPSLLSLLIHEGIEKCTSLKKVFTVGERLPVSLQREFFKKLPDAKLYVFYGCTEAPAATFREILPDEDFGDRVVLGKPNFNKRVYILDEFQVPVPPGIPGEIFIGGKISRGYIRNESLTKERFIKDPFSPREDARMYQTGDMGRFLSDGNIEFLGRTDFQVQVRGIRVEPAEIDLCINRHPGIKECVTIAQEDGRGDYRFIAYIVPNDPDNCPASEELTNFVRNKLPYYLVPSQFVQLEEIPLLLNGKIDRKSLPVQTIVGTRDSDEHSAPRTELEKDLVSIWEYVLRVDQIGIYDNFFDLGGSSLNILRVCHRIKETVGKTISVADIFGHPTIAEIAGLLQQVDQSTRYVQKFGGDNSNTPVFFLPGITRNALVFSQLALVMSDQRPSYGIELPPSENGIEPLGTIEELAKHCAQEIRSIQPEGPYHLAGFSFGGLVAFETARQLENTENVFLFDSRITKPRDPSLLNHIKWGFKWLVREKHHYFSYVATEAFLRIARALRLMDGPPLLPQNEFMLGDISPIGPGIFNQKYVPKTLDANLLVFTARNTEYSFRSGKELEDWKQLSSGKVDYVRIDTPLHNNVLDNEYLSEIAEHVNSRVGSKT